MPVLRALTSIRRAKLRTWQWFGIYLFAAAIVLESLLALGIHFLPDLKEFAVNSLFPESWRPFVLALGERLFAERMATIIATAGMTIAVLAVGITLFPIKEKLSAQFERDAFPDLPRGRELSLIRQGYEELKLLALYAVFLSLSLYLGLQGHAGLALTGSILGYAYLVAAMALDHAAPIFQRRGLELLHIIYLLLRRAPLSLFTIGALCIAPAIFLQFWATGNLPPGKAIALVAAAEVIGMALATLFGCSLGAELIKAGAAEERAPRGWKWGITGLVTIILIWQGIFFGWWTLTAHHMSPLLKCKYSIDWRETDIASRGAEFENGRVATIQISAPLLITNPTSRDAALKNATVEFRQNGDLLTSADLPTLAVPANASAETQLELEFEFPIDLLQNNPLKLFRSETWTTLEILIQAHPPLSNPVPLYHRIPR